MSAEFLASFATVGIFLIIFGALMWRTHSPAKDNRFQAR